jgi:hypothetical protein
MADHMPNCLCVDCVPTDRRVPRYDDLSPPKRGYHLLDGYAHKLECQGQCDMRVGCYPQWTTEEIERMGGKPNAPLILNKIQAPDPSAERKATPVYSGVLRYFPDAIAAVARLSKKGNDKHNPGEPLHWSRGKSNDHGDCIVRHQMTPDELDPDTGEIHAVAVAWRALAQLQLLEEKRRGKPDPDFAAFVKEAERNR